MQNEFWFTAKANFTQLIISSLFTGGFDPAIKNTEMSYPSVAFGQDMQGKTTDEFAAIQIDNDRSACMPIIFGPEGDLTVGNVQYPGIGNGDLVGVSGQVFDDLPGTKEGSFGIDHPGLAK